MQTINLELNVLNVSVTSRGVERKVDLTKLSHDILRSLLAHGLNQKVADAASGAKAQAIEMKFGPEANKADAAAWIESESGQRALTETTGLLMDKAIDALLEGKWTIREGSGTRVTMTPEQELAHSKARDALTAIFKAACVRKGIKGTVANFVTLGDQAKKYFAEKGKGYVWQESSVAAFIAAQAEAGKRDFMAEAREELAAQAAMIGDVGLDDLLGEL